MKKAFVIFIIAFLIRAIFLFFWETTENSDQFPSDAYYYRDTAKSLLEGKGFSVEGPTITRRPPVYTLFLVCFLSLGCFPLGVFLAQSLLGAMSCSVLYLLGKKLFDESTGFWASLFLAIDYLTVRMGVVPLPEILFTFLLLFSLFLFYNIDSTRWNLNGILAGICAGLAVLTKDVLLWYCPLLLISIFFQKQKSEQIITSAISLFLGLLITIGPWSVRTSLLHKQLVLTTTVSGITFYLGNNPLAVCPSTGGETEDLWSAVASDPVVRSNKVFTPEGNHYFFKKGITCVMSNPADFVRRCKDRLINMWRPYQTDSPMLTRWLTAIGFFLMMIFGSAGLIWNGRRWRDLLPLWLLLAYFVFIHAITLACIRYRIPITPILMLFAGWSVSRLTMIAGSSLTHSPQQAYLP